MAFLLASTALHAADQSPVFHPIHNADDFYDSKSPLISRDGNVIAGYGYDSNFMQFAWRWTEGSGMKSIHNHAQFNSSIVSVLSQNGDVLAGDGIHNSGNAHAWRWTDATGMKSIHNAAQFQDSWVITMSQNGDVIAGGGSHNSGNNYAWRWTDATGMQSIHNVAQFQYSSVNAMSQNGDVITGGGAHNSGNNYAWRWTNATGMQSIHDSPLLLSSSAEAMSQNGAVIAGNGNTGSNDHAWRWTDATGMKSIHDSTLFQHSWFSTMSQNGDVIAGNGQDISSGYLQSWRWTNATGMQSIHNSDLFEYSEIKLMNDNGKVIAGYGHDGSYYNQAWRWTDATGMQSIHTLQAATSDPKAISENGNIIAGTWSNSGGANRRAVINPVTSGHNSGVFRWTNETGMQDIYTILTDHGIDMSGWSQLDSGYDISMSAKGDKITGTGYYNSTSQAWLFVLPTKDENGNNNGGGLITPEELGRSFAQSTSPLAQSQSAIASSLDQSLMVARNTMTGYFGYRPYSSSTRSASPQSLAAITPAADMSMRPAYRKAIYATGALGIGQNDDFSNHAANGTLGILAETNHNTAIGAGVVASHSNLDTYLDGSSKTTAKGVQIIGAHEADNGFRLYGVATFVDMDISNTRRYMNGGGVDSSKGKTDGIGYGAAIKTGYEFAVPNTSSLSLMPYAELDVSRVHMDAYTETRGGFPAHVASQNKSYVASRIGAEASYQFNPDVTLRGRAAWGHRYSDGGTAISTIAGMTQSVNLNAGDRNWMDVGVGANWQISDRTTVTTDLSGRIGKTAEPAIAGMVGIVWKFD